MNPLQDLRNQVVKADPIVVPTLVMPAGWTPSLTSEQEERLRAHFSSSKGTLHSLPIVCKWQDCLYKSGCLLYQMQVSPPPLGLPCPMEATDVEKIMRELMVELEVEEKDVTDMSILRELVTWTILEKRALAELAMDPKNIREAVVGVDPEGDPIMKEQMNPVIIMLEKAGKMKQKYREALIATREAKAKDKSRTQTSVSDVAAAIMQKIEAKKRRLEGVVIDVTPLPAPAATPTLPSSSVLPPLPSFASEAPGGEQAEVIEAEPDLDG